LIYNLISSRPAVADVCDVCGGQPVADVQGEIRTRLGV
jgi:hypothetical protein